jgi:hypothetical protein
MEAFLYFVAGSLVTWLVTMIYYRRSSVKAPKWARPLIESLPDEPLDKDHFVKLLEASLKDRVIDGGTF